MLSAMVRLCFPVPLHAGDISSQNTTYFGYTVDQSRFSEGSHEVITTVIDANGNSDQQTIPFTVPPALGKYLVFGHTIMSST